jgi:hypothetical protein
MSNKIVLTALAIALGLSAAAGAAHAGKGVGGFKPGGGGGPGPGNWGGPGGFAPGGNGPGGGGGSGGWGGWGGGFGIHINPGYHGGYRDERISCRTGRRIVGRSGFRRVRVIECNGGTYTYRAKRGSRHYRISVDAYDGAIVSRRRL